MPGFSIFTQEQEAAPPPKAIFPTFLWVIRNLGPITGLDISDRIYAKDISTPTISFDVEELTETGAALVYKFARRAKWDDVTVTFYDTKGLTASLESWKSLVWSDTQGIRPSAEYKKDSEFLLVNAFGNPILRYRLKNSWPRQIGYGRLTYTENDAKIVNLTLTYDFAEVNEL
jgi:hypothetical protein